MYFADDGLDDFITVEIGQIYKQTQNGHRKNV